MTNEEFKKMDNAYKKLMKKGKNKPIKHTYMSISDVGEWYKSPDNEALVFQNLPKQFPY